MTAAQSARAPPPPGPSTRVSCTVAPGITAPLGSLTSPARSGCLRPLRRAPAAARRAARIRPPSAIRPRCRVDVHGSLQPSNFFGSIFGLTLTLPTVHSSLVVPAHGAPQLVRELDAADLAPVVEEQRELDHRRRLAAQLLTCFSASSRAFFRSSSVISRRSGAGCAAAWPPRGRLRRLAHRAAGRDHSRLRSLIGDHQRQVRLAIDEQPGVEAVGVLHVDDVGLAVGRLGLAGIGELGVERRMRGRRTSRASAARCSARALRSIVLVDAFLLLGRRLLTGRHRSARAPMRITMPPPAIDMFAPAGRIALSPSKPLRHAAAHRPAEPISERRYLSGSSSRISMSEVICIVLTLRCTCASTRQRLQRVELLVADRLARGGQHFGGLAVFGAHACRRRRAPARARTTARFDFSCRGPLRHREV